MPIALTQSSLSVSLLMAQGILGDYLTQSLWKAPGHQHLFPVPRDPLVAGSNVL